MSFVHSSRKGAKNPALLVAAGSYTSGSAPQSLAPVDGGFSPHLDLHPKKRRGPISSLKQFLGSQKTTRYLSGPQVPFATPKPVRMVPRPNVPERAPFIVPRTYPTSRAPARRPTPRRSFPRPVTTPPAAPRAPTVSHPGQSAALASVTATPKGAGSKVKTPSRIPIYTGKRTSRGVPALGSPTPASPVPLVPATPRASPAAVCAHCGSPQTARPSILSTTAVLPKTPLNLPLPPSPSPSLTFAPVPSQNVRVSMGTQTEACEAPAPAVNTEVALGPSEEHRRAMAGIGALFGQPRLKGSKVHRRVRGLQGAEASTSDDLLAELKKHFSTPPCLETVDTSPADNETPSPPSPRTVLRARPRVHREKNDVPEKSELELLFERRKSRDQQFDVALDTPLLAVGQHDPSPAKACLRRPLSEIHPQNLTIRSDAGPCVTTNTTTTTASPDLAITPFGMRKLRRVVVPPLLEGAQASRDPRILLELDSLRSRGKVGGDGQTEGMPEREMSLAVQGILRKNRKENQKSS